MRTMIKRAGMAAALFFLIKGLVWLALLAGAAGWAGGARAAGLSTPRSQNKPQPNAAEDRGSSSNEAWAQKVPMGAGARCVS
ncbi:MAG: hypothetical protein QM783_01480 [Phycisphaerales bacterium]